MSGAAHLCLYEIDDYHNEYRYDIGGSPIKSFKDFIDRIRVRLFHVFSFSIMKTIFDVMILSCADDFFIGKFHTTNIYRKTVP